MRAKVLLSVVLLVTVALSIPAWPKPEDDFTLIRVADGVYAGIAKPGGLASGNAGFVVGQDSVLVFDTFFTPAAADELLEVIQGQTKLPVKYAVNSHYHLDHTGGNQVFA